MAKHRMAQSQHLRTDLGLYFGDEDEEQLEQEDKALSYLVLATDQDDAFDPVDTENLLAQMSAGKPFAFSLASHVSVVYRTMYLC